jgi:hypothetical protein|tara:strand:+ start:26772 stop:26975 length:204 start_codon:yes stop_codon:yes gene_type:complete
MRRRVPNGISEERLERALRTMTSVIDHYGETYRPIFEVLESMLHEKQKLKRSLAKYRKTSFSETCEM